MRHVGKRLQGEGVAMGTANNVVLEKLVDLEEDKWVVFKMKHIIPGDTFRMWKYVNSEWSLHEYKGQTEFKAVGNPYIHPTYGVWTVKIEDTEDENNTDGQDRS
jgi:hypothetical protein